MSLHADGKVTFEYIPVFGVCRPACHDSSLYIFGLVIFLEAVHQRFLSRFRCSTHNLCSEIDVTSYVIFIIRFQCWFERSKFVLCCFFSVHVSEPYAIADSTHELYTMSLHADGKVTFEYIPVFGVCRPACHDSSLYIFGLVIFLEAVHQRFLSRFRCSTHNLCSEMT